MLRLASAIALLLTVLTTGVQAQDRILLGQQTVGFRVDRDVINIGQTEDWYRTRSFRALQFVAQRNDVFLINIQIVYINGYTENMRIERVIPQNSVLRVDLPGERSYLRRIEMVYRARPDFRGQAVVQVFGELFRRPGPPPNIGNWENLGCQQVSLFGRDRDSVRVGRREGRFKAIRLHVRDADVEILDLKVIYANGQPDDIQVRNLIRAGERTRPLDLRGWERAIDRVDLVYRTAHNPAQIITQQRFRSATVCVEGLR